MEVFETIKNRRSVRSFLDKPVEEEKLQKILEAASLAPSAGNTQEWRFITIKNKELRIKIGEIALEQSFIAEAAVVIVISFDLQEIEIAYRERGVKRYSFLDCGIAAQNLMLQAEALGLGTCPVGAFDDKEVRKILNLPENLRPVLIIPLGYPRETPPQTPRKSLEEIVIEK